MCMEITTYQLASSLIAKGMDWKQAVGTVLLGNLIVLVPMLLNAHAGAKYGIPFPVFIRAPFGVRGANIAAILRAVVACGWFGIQSWIGGTAIHCHARRHLARHHRQAMRSCGPASSASGCSTWSSSGAASNPSAACKPSARPSCSSWPQRCSSGCASRQAASEPCSPRRASSSPPVNFSPSSFRRSPPWSATGPRSRSTFPTSRATRNRRARNRGARHSAFPSP